MTNTETLSHDIYGTASQPAIASDTVAVDGKLFVMPNDGQPVELDLASLDCEQLEAIASAAARALAARAEAGTGRKMAA